MEKDNAGRNRISLDLFAIIIAFIAAIFAGWQIHETKKHNKLSLRPHLDASFRASNDLDFRGWRVDNAGLGPAFIEELNFSYNGEPIKRELEGNSRSYLQLVLDAAGWPRDNASRDRILRTTLPHGAVLNAGSEVYIFKIDSELTSEEFVKLRGLEMEIKYRSIYREKCEIDFDPKKDESYKHKICK